MSYAYLIPLQVFGLGFIISLFMAVLIKFMLSIIAKFPKPATEANK